MHFSNNMMKLLKVKKKKKGKFGTKTSVKKIPKDIETT